ncbi:MAG: hypothetical protein NXY57DRAFT_1018795 [Lentinula lateritia]|nr:MAG: hypothetical protein NXY57DRAFT_1018795 [Lentinula lateritia]
MEHLHTLDNDHLPLILLDFDSLRRPLLHPHLPLRWSFLGQTESPNRSLTSPSPSCATPCLVIVNTQNAYFSTERSERQGESSRSDKRKPRDAGPGAAHSDKDLSTKGLRYSSDGKIEKPTGGVGKPGRGGYNLLRVALKWPEKRFNEVKKFIDETVEAKLDCLQPLGKQQYLKLEEVRTLAVAKFSFLEEYRGDWVVYDFIRCRLKYRKQALKRTASMKAAADSGSRQRISCYLNSDSWVAEKGAKGTGIARRRMNM